MKNNLISPVAKSKTWTYHGSNSSKLAASNNKDVKEKAQKCEFVQGLLMSTILDELWLVIGSSEEETLPVKST